MRKVITKTGIVCSFLILALQLTSCYKSTKKTVASAIEVAEVIAPTAMVPEEIIYRSPIVFITGIDKGSAHYYEDARSYFKEKEYQIVEDQYSIEEIITWLNNHESDSYFGDIHIVNKSNPYKGLTLETVIRGEKVTTETLRKNITQGKLPKLKKVVAQNSKIIFHADGLGSNTALMKTIKDALIKLDVLAKDAILFVVNEKDNLIGSLTDWDPAKGLPFTRLGFNEFEITVNLADELQ